MPPLPRNIQTNSYSNQPSFVPCRAVRFREPVYSNCNRSSLTFYSKQPNFPKCTYFHFHCINSDTETVPAQLPSGHMTAMMYTILLTLGAHEVPTFFWTLATHSGQDSQFHLSTEWLFTIDIHHNWNCTWSYSSLYYCKWSFIPSQYRNSRFHSLFTSSISGHKINEFAMVLPSADIGISQ